MQLSLDLMLARLNIPGSQQQAAYTAGGDRGGHRSYFGHIQQVAIAQGERSDKQRHGKADTAEPAGALPEAAPLVESVRRRLFRFNHQVHRGASGGVSPVDAYPQGAEAGLLHRGVSKALVSRDAK